MIGWGKCMAKLDGMWMLDRYVWCERVFSIQTFVMDFIFALIFLFFIVAIAATTTKMASDHDCVGKQLN